MRIPLRLAIIAAAVGAVVAGTYAWRDTRIAEAYGPSTWNVPTLGLVGGERDGDRERGERRERGGDFALVALPDDVAASLPAETRSALVGAFGEGRIPQRLLDDLRAGRQVRLPGGGERPPGDDDGPFGDGGRERGREGGEGGRGGGIRLGAADGFVTLALPLVVLCGIAGAWEVVRRRRHARDR